MGNLQTKSNSEKKKEKREVIIDTKNDLKSSFTASTNKIINLTSSGEKTCCEKSKSDLNKNYQEEETTECQTIPDSKIEIKLPTTFEWKEGGSIVYITGSFSNWSQWFIMTRINNKFELVLVKKFPTFLRTLKNIFFCFTDLII